MTSESSSSMDLDQQIRELEERIADKPRNGKLKARLSTLLQRQSKLYAKSDTNKESKLRRRAILIAKEAIQVAPQSRMDIQH